MQVYYGHPFDGPPATGALIWGEGADWFVSLYKNHGWLGRLTHDLKLRIHGPNTELAQCCRRTSREEAEEALVLYLLKENADG